MEALFLHGGPGLSSGVERLWFGSDLAIRWWDQPPVGGEASPFASLVEAAEMQLAAMAAQGPVRLVAHSFGGQIAHALARKHPGLIGRITLLGCVADPVTGIFRLSRRIAALDGSAELARAILAAEAALNPETFEAMVMAAAASPAYPAVYFGPGSTAARDRFLTLLPRIDFLDLATFLGVMNEFLHAPALEPVPMFDGKVDLVMGRYDPVILQDDDLAEWRRIFPRAKSLVADSGHFVHLEAAPAAWLPF